MVNYTTIHQWESLMALICIHNIELMISWYDVIKLDNDKVIYKLNSSTSTQVNKLGPL